MSFLISGFQKQCPTADLRIGNAGNRGNPGNPGNIGHLGHLEQRGDLGALEDIEAAVCWNPPHGLLARMPNLKMIQSIAAGVDHILSDASLPAGVPVCRVIDPGMAAGMCAYVNWAVIHHQRHFDRYLAHAARRKWQEEPIVSPRRHRVGIAGFGWLGSACARALATVGFSVSAWHLGTSRPVPPGVAVYRGDQQLDDFLGGCDTLVCLLPLTSQTAGFLGAPVFEKLPRGAHVVNVGRGAHLVEDDLLAAIASGQLSGATLDTFAREPLPAEHPFWNEPRITITPHIASRTDLGVIVAQTLDNLAQVRRGLRPAAAVDARRGY